MITKLTLHDAGRTMTNGVIGSGPVYVYRVGGMPAGEEARIAEFNHSWRIPALERNITWQLDGPVCERRGGACRVTR